MYIYLNLLAISLSDLHEDEGKCVGVGACVGVHVCACISLICVWRVWGGGECIVYIFSIFSFLIPVSRDYFLCICLSMLSVSLKEIYEDKWKCVCVCVCVCVCMCVCVCVCVLVHTCLCVFWGGVSLID